MDMNGTLSDMSLQWITTTNTLTITLLTFVIYYISTVITDPIRKLPGPNRLPVIGSIHHLDKDRPHISLTNLAKTHGPVFGIQLFRDPFVVVSSFEHVWDVLVKRSYEFSGRMHSVRSDLCLGEDVFSQEGEVHALRKKLFMKIMRTYGSGLIEMENLLSRANEAFVAYLDKNEGKEINIAELIGDYVCTVTTVLMCGEEFDFEDPAVTEVKILTKTVLDFSSPTGDGSEVESFGFLRKVPYLKNKYLKAEDAIKKMKKETVGKRSAHYQKNFEMNKNENRGILHQVIDAMKHDLNDDGSPKYPEEFLEGMCMDLLLGAIETTRRTTTQILLELCKQPEITHRVQQEIDTVIGRGRQPKLSDKKYMHFTDAVIEEAQRLLALIPLLVHKTLKDVELGGYSIPKNTRVLINVWEVQHDSEVYPDPYKFNPHRFLDENGHLLPHDHPVKKRSLPFGAGRRVCAGEVFAKSRLFLLLTTMLQNYDFTLCDTNINSDVRSYRNEVVLEVPEHVPMIFTHRK